MYYRRRCFGKADVNSKFVPHDENQVAISLKYSKYDIYYSIFKYNQEQKNKGDVKGLTNLVGDCLIWDFDDKENPENSRQDAISLCNKLLSNNIPEEAIRVAFSGSKGIHVRVNLNEDISVADCKSICTTLAKEYKSFDTVIYNANRIFRALGSYHKEANLYKIPLTLEELANLNIETIRELAKDQTVFEQTPIQYTTIDLPEHFKPPVEKVEPKIEPEGLPTIDFSKKIKGWSNCKWALYNGIGVEPSNRHEKILCVLATSKALNYTKDGAYYNAKHAYEKGLEIYGGEKKENWKEELLRDRDSVYSSDWKGGTYSCRDKENWLYEFCQSLGEHKCDGKEEEIIKVEKLEDIRDSFKNYVTHIEKNTILTGLPSLDNKVFLSTGANVGIIGAPGSGKTSIALDILNHTSKAGVPSVLASLDMHKNRLFEKVLYRVSGKKRQELYDIFKNNQEDDIMEKLKEEFGNVNFFHKSCPTVEDIKKYILKCEEENGQKIKLVMLDYFERITNDFNDDTAASKKVAGDLQDLVNELDICLVTLVQPNKNALGGSADNPILSYTNIKGSSYVYQAFRIIWSIWRPFYNPQDFSDDKYMQMAILKNDLGELSELSFGWDGPQGRIYEINNHEKQEFEEMLLKKFEKKANEKKNDGWN